MAPEVEVEAASAPAPPAPAPSAVAAPAPAPGPSAARSAAMVNAGMILARLVGLVRQNVQAHYFGTSAYADVIAAAFRVGNITQNLLGEGTLSASFIPVYAKLRAAGKPQEAKHFALAALGLLLVVVGVASALGAAGAPWLAWLIAAGFDAERLDGTARLVRVVFPMTGLLVLSAWALGVLNAHRRFFLPYAAPVLWSVAQIVGLWGAARFLGAHDEGLALALGWSAVAGAGLQLLVLLPAARSLLGGLRPRLDLKDPSVREAARRLPGVLIGRGVIQISGLVDMLLVSFLGTGANAAFNYAQSIYLFPMSLLGTGEAAVALPEMAGDTAELDLEKRNAKLRARLGASLGRLTVVSLPVTAVLAVLAREMITALLRTGRFDHAAEARVEPLLMAYALALLGNASGRVLTTAFYALGDTRTPARYAVYRVVASSLLSLALMRELGVLGVVLGAVTAAWIESGALAWNLARRIGGLGLAEVKLGRAILLGAITVAPSLAARALVPAAIISTRLGALGILALAGVTLAIAAPALGLFDVRSMMPRARR
ncbi:MAG TPA: murein biosynthesis integral membrane protein MurJ [Byssovorax sp.]